jgi:hypothetical protein
MMQPDQPKRTTAKAQWLLIQLVLILAVSLQTAWSVQAQPTFTGGQAISALRTRPGAPAGSGYQILRKFQPAVDGVTQAKLAIEKTRDEDHEVFLDGALIGLLRDGGYLLVEYDRATDQALALHLVTRGEDGREAIETDKIETPMTVRDVADVVDYTQAYLTKVFTSRTSELIALVTELDDKLRTNQEPDDDNDFEVPREALQFTTTQDVQEIRTLRLRLECWSFRYALSLPEYAANPKAALLDGYGERDKLLVDFLAMKGISEEHLQEELAVGPINGPQQFKDRLAWFRDLNAYLDAHGAPEQSRAMFSLNLAMATVPLQISGSQSGEGVISFCGSTAALFIPCWTRQPDGDLSLTGLAEDD